MISNCLFVHKYVYLVSNFWLILFLKICFWIMVVSADSILSMCIENLDDIYLYAVFTCDLDFLDTESYGCFD